MTRTICGVDWHYHADGRVTLSFHNYLTDVHEDRTYKTRSAARAAETKFQNRVNRIYCEQRMREVWNICT